MEKIRLNELNKALRQCGIGLDLDEIENTPAFGVYHVHNWNHGYDGFYGIKVYEDGSYDDGTADFHGTRRQFYRDMQETIDFLLEYLRFKNIQELIIAPCYRYSPFSSDDVERNDIYEEIYAFLRKNNVRKNERSGIKTNIEDDIGPLEMIVEGAFRGISDLCLFVPTHKMLIAPDHHFGFTFFTQQKSHEVETVAELLSGYPDLRCFNGKEG
ncbi:hypothetical protein [uncultured Fretibacterium sp.]|uniref:hypothetical protein n=1 Tax=uncultured Fretibacterium sp. TaxID=1678694 RepID=UPI00325FCA22